MTRQLHETQTSEARGKQSAPNVQSANSGARLPSRCTCLHHCVVFHPG